MTSRTIQSIELDFHIDGERISLLQGRRITTGEFAALIASRTKKAHKAFAINEASRLGPEFLCRVRDELRSRMSQAALDNLWSLGTHIVPLMIRHGLTASSVDTVKCAVRVLFYEGTETLRPDAADVYESLKAGTISQQKIRERASAHKASSSSSREASELLRERKRLKKRLDEIDMLLKRLPS